MKKVSVAKLHNISFKNYAFTGKWEALLGNPAKGFGAFIYGESGQGKTTFSLQLAAYLTTFGKVLYYSIEEGISSTIQNNIQRSGLNNNPKLILGQYDYSSFDSAWEDLIAECHKKRSANFIIIDSLEYSEISSKDIKKFKREFPLKNILIIGRAEGNKPFSSQGKKVYYDLDIAIYVRDFVAYIQKNRFGGGQALDIVNN
jgi:hypothetical protein